jgi:hypothetical protein
MRKVRGLGPALWVAAAVGAALPASASGAVTIGPDPLPQRTSVIGQGGASIYTSNVVPGATLSSPLDGVVVHWRARRGQGPGALPADTITLRVLRPTGTVNEFTAVRTSDAQAVPAGSNDPVSVHEFPTRLPIKIGDRVGLGTNTGTFPNREIPGASYLVRISALADGQTAVFAAGAFADRAVLINADIEPDADGDGFGDETQDQCPTDPSKQGDCTPPDTKITSGPKGTSNNASPSFGFSSSESGSSFECELDDGGYSSCSSPKNYSSLADGAHTFSVRATDPADNTDPSPATRSFTVDTSLEGSAGAKKKQPQKGKTIRIKVKVAAGEDLEAKGTGKVKVKKSSYKLKTETKSVSEGKKKILKLKPKKSKDAKKIAKALKQGKKAKAKLTVKLTDEAGNSKSTKLSVTLKR